MIAVSCAAQDIHSGDTLTPPAYRKWVVAGGHAAVWTGTFIALNKAWYADYSRSNFHLFNDGSEWLQMDKAGHVWTAYQLGRASAATWKWAGFSDRKAAWFGAGSALAFQSIIEIQDGFSDKWGFSVWDMVANVSGAGIFLAQELGWKEQRLQVKMGYWPYDYPSDLVARRDELFGEGGSERVLKDYNSQTYWLSANLRSFFPDSGIPRWLNVSLGYSADLMLGGEENKWTTDDGVVVDRTDIPRVRRFYLSVDADLTKIRTRSKFLKSVFFLVNAVKVPAPSVQFSKDGIRGYWIHQ
ncbi:hypothetical protein FPE01S_05_00220 [Flavihumibacter petaseus NBRC 106054]|uniref:DUF2279 domain-containing protein n=2 Tax=Flavihumibacter TaxID=1004301 RepID=A0A0E9N7J1_9BACT|nr:hypothetical protein FPE01S_05_00220 [Flavihumibacter petaseus NBRC 106054]